MAQDVGFAPQHFFFVFSVFVTVVASLGLRPLGRGVSTAVVVVVVVVVVLVVVVVIFS
jgi:hypothetical protein